MEKILIAILIMSLLGVFTTSLSLVIGVKLCSAIFLGIMTTDVAVTIMYFPDMISNSNLPEIPYILGYISITGLSWIVYIIYTFLSDPSERCVCRCCRRMDYQYIDD